ncbi:MAG: hypothetical protein IKP21_01670 [Bacteroidales bacterium]|nr:hypothetical protein [Bacteroidales bacterium]
MHFFKRKKVPLGTTLINQVMHPHRPQITKTNTYGNPPQKADLIFKHLPKQIIKQAHKTLFNTQGINPQTPADLSTYSPSRGAFFEKKFQTLGKISYIKSLGEKLNFRSQN